MKQLLTQLTIGLLFVIGANITAMGGVLAFVSGVFMYFLGYWLMDQYKKAN